MTQTVTRGGRDGAVTREDGVMKLAMDELDSGWSWFGLVWDDIR